MELGFEARIREIPETAVGFIVMHGPYDQMQPAFAKLYSWVAANGLKAVGMPMAVFTTDPAKTPEFEAEWELQVPVEDAAAEFGPNEKGLGIKTVETSTVACTVYVGPYDGMRPAYQALSRWLSDRSYEACGPPIEVYLSDPESTPLENHETEIRIPVKKVRGAGGREAKEAKSEPESPDEPAQSLFESQTAAASPAEPQAATEQSLRAESE